MLPGMTMGPWGTNFERTITWWEQSRAWLAYISRCQYLLQAGRFAADIVYFEGDDGPNDLPLLKGNLVPEGYDYDGCDATAVQRMTVENGEIVLPSGMHYAVLMLPDTPYLTVKSLRKITELVRDGATIIGKPFTASPTLSEQGAGDAEIKILSTLLWGDTVSIPGAIRQVGKGHVITAPATTKATPFPFLAPDVSPTTGNTRSLVWIHRKMDDTDLYFVANQRTQPLHRSISFRITGRQPELWNPETGTIENAPIWRTKDSRTEVDLTLGPAESVFVVFRKPAGHTPHLTRLTAPGTPQAPLTRADGAVPRLTVEKAFYEAVDGTGGADVTPQVQQLVDGGETVIPADNSTFGDTIPNHVKRLRVLYTLDGKQYERSIGENDNLDLLAPDGNIRLPDYEIFTNGGKTLLRSWTPGTYAAGWNDEGGSTPVTAVTTITTPPPQSVVLTNSWKVTFPPHLGAPPTVTLDKLISWTEHTDPGVRYFSGTATYETTFDLPRDFPKRGHAQYLDLGKVKNFAEVTLNGKALPLLWMPPFRLNVTDIVRPGHNTLTVRVTNLWPNRLIGDEQEPEEVSWRGGAIAAWPDWLIAGKPRPASKRVTFTTWQFYSKDSPLLESGLIGPVTLYAVPEIPLAIPHGR
jgi:hypothetical protein